LIWPGPAGLRADYPREIAIMPESLPRPDRAGWLARWTAALVITLTWLLVVVVAIARLRQTDGIIIALGAVVASAMTLAITARADRVRWRIPIENMTRFVRDLSQDRHANPSPASEPELVELTLEIATLANALRNRSTKGRATRLRTSQSPPEAGLVPSTAFLTRSGLFDAPRPPDLPSEPADPNISGDYSTSDMVNRLEPDGFRWIESSTAEQILLGWTLEELRRKSFLDTLHPDDRSRAEETFALALVRGEALGLVVRMRTAHGKTRAIEVNVGARYGTNHKVTHLRCHLTDVTDKVRAERELRLRSLELTQVNEQLRRINRELEELKNRLARANDELSLRNRELDEFVYVVSHDLQEPLRTLTAFSDFLLRDYGDLLEGEGQEYVRYLVDASRRMRAMIHGMLKLSRVGKVIGETTLIDLDELIAEIKTDLGELFRTRGAALLVVGPLPNIWGDRDRMRQLLANLISNGIKYNKSPDPWIEVRGDIGIIPETPDVESDPKPETTVTIAVKDNGIGIDPQFHLTIFQLFRRLHTRDEYEGTGVGLAICNKIVQAHGGRIWVKSALGQGATFYIKLRNRVSSPVTTHALSLAASAPRYEAAASQGSADEPN
jgi:PAS domain S-box-containing protein